MSADTQTAPSVPARTLLARERAAAIAAHGLAGTLHDYPAEPLSSPDWQALLGVVRRQRLTGMLVAAVAVGTWPVTEDQHGDAVEAHVDATSGVLQLEWMLLKIFDDLATVDVEPRVLKGSAVAHLDYPRPHERIFGDVDLLVRPEDFDRAVAGLTAAGYKRRFPQPRPGFDRRFSKGTSFITPAGFELDLHRTFVMGPYGLLVDLSTVWAVEETFSLAGRAVPALAREIRFLHACFHAALGDIVPRLVPQRDVVQMLLSDRLDLEVVRAVMQDWQAEAVVARALCLAWDTLAIADEVALSAWAQRYRPDSTNRRYLSVYSDRAGSYAAKELVALGAIPRLRDRAAFLYALLLPDDDYLTGRHAGRRQRVGRALRAVRGSVRR